MIARFKKLFLALILIFLLIYFINYLNFLSFGKKIIEKTINMGIGVVYHLSINKPQVFKFSVNNKLKNENLKLSQEISKLKIEQANFILLQEENLELRKQLNFFVTTSYSNVGAEVIGKSFDISGKTIIINRGKKSNIQPGQPVITGDGVLIGKILKVNESSSLIRLINDNQSKIAVTLLNKDKSIGVAEGGFGISIRVNLIPQNEVVNVGDLIVTSGLEKGIPRGILVGIVESVEKEAFEPFQKAIITPVVNLEKLVYVSIIKDE